MSKPTASIHEEFEAAFNAGDLEALTALYEPAAVLKVGDAVAHGPAAIREAYRGFLARQPEIHVETLEVLETGEGLAMLHGRWREKWTGPDGTEFQTEGRNTEVVRRQPDGTWRFLIDNPFAP